MGRWSSLKDKWSCIPTFKNVNEEQADILDFVAYLMSSMTEFKINAFCFMVTEDEKIEGPEDLLHWIIKDNNYKDCSKEYLEQCKNATDKLFYHEILLAKKHYVNKRG